MRRCIFTLIIVGIVLGPLLPGVIVRAQSQPPAGGFIQAAGSQLVWNGQPVQVKGVYYESQNYSPLEMWQYWDSTRIAHDLQLAREQLGVNVIWVHLPYLINDEVSTDGVVTEELIVRLREMLEIVGNLDMRLVITLFDDYTTFPLPDRDSEAKNARYLEQLIGNFVGDDRILGWNIYDRPDDSSKWDDERAQVVSWLVRRANQVQNLAPDHLVMLSMDNAVNLWETDFGGNTLLDQVDVVMVRGSDVDDILEDVDYIRTRTAKPVLVYGFNQPTGPPCRARRYTEEQQAAVHRAMLPKLLGEGHVQGVLFDTLLDINSGTLDSWDDKAFYRGFFDLNYRPKAAAAEVRAYQVAALPSIVKIDLPLRAVSYKPPYIFVEETAPEGAPRPIEGTTHYVKRDMRRAWDTFGGQYSFGLPLTEAYKRAEDNRVVQYFEAAALDLHPEERDKESYDNLGRFERLMAVVRVMDVGSEYARANGLVFAPPTSDPGGRYFPETGHYLTGDFLGFYKRANGEWRLGAPLSEAFPELINGKQTMVQYFQKGRLEINPDTGAIQFGHLGVWRFQQQCANMP